MSPALRKRGPSALGVTALSLGLALCPQVLTRARGQDPGASTPPATKPAAGAGGAVGAVRQVGDLSTRYRLLERAAASVAEAQPYQVATVDVLKVIAEKAQGTPDRTERTVQVIYTERPAVFNASGAVTETVRRYDALRISPAPPSKPSAPKLLDGLNLWYKSRSGANPLLISLDPARAIGETEYKIIAERQIFLTDLAGVLPALPSRVGDRWRVPKAAAQALFGERPASAGEPLVGTLLDVRPGLGSGKDRVAVIAVTGRALLPHTGDTSLNAQILFTFTPTDAAPAAAPTTATAAPAGVVDARGAITDVRLARSSVSAVPGSNGRLRMTRTAEISLQRKFNAGSAITIPAVPPLPNEANSWLSYEDAKGRFHFRHPQDFLPQPLPFGEGDGVVQLGDARADAAEGRLITLTLQAKTGNAAADRAARDPDTHVRDLKEQWTRSRSEVLQGPAGWLPESDWAPLKMKVHRIEAALKPAGPEGRGSKRIFLDYYLVLFTQNETLVIEAMTGQDPPLPFRQQVEAILKTFQLGPAPVKAQAPTPPVATPPESGTVAPPAAPRPPG